MRSVRTTRCVVLLYAGIWYLVTRRPPSAAGARVHPSDPLEA